MEELVTLDIPAKAEYVVLCRLALAGLLMDRGFSDDAVADLKLALTEACTNSIRHAYPDGGCDAGTVHVSYTVRKDRVVLAVYDEGSGFDEDEPPLEQLADGALLPSEGGMGMALIRAIVDEFLLERPPGGGTRLTLTKLRDA